MQPICFFTWRRSSKCMAKSFIIDKQSSYNFTKAKDEGYKFTKGGNSEVASKEAEDELRCQILRFEELYWNLLMMSFPKIMLKILNYHAEILQQSYRFFSTLMVNFPTVLISFHNHKRHTVLPWLGLGTPSPGARTAWPLVRVGSCGGSAWMRRARAGGAPGEERPGAAAAGVVFSSGRDETESYRP